MCYLKLPFIIIDSTFKENHIVKKIMYFLDTTQAIKRMRNPRMSNPSRRHKHKENSFGPLINFLLKNLFSILFS